MRVISIFASMKFDKANGKWLLDLVDKLGLEGAADAENYDLHSLEGVMEDIKYMKYHGEPFYEKMFSVLKKPRSVIKETPEEVSQLILKHGATRTASILGVSYVTFRRYLDLNGMTSLPKKISALSLDKLKSYLEEGLSAQEIANKEHVHVQTVYQRIRAEGLRTPGKRISNTEMFNDLTELITSKDDPEKAYYELLKCLSSTAFKKELLDIVKIF